MLLRKSPAVFFFSFACVKNSLLLNNPGEPQSTAIGPTEREEPVEESYDDAGYS